MSVSRLAKFNQEYQTYLLVAARELDGVRHTRSRVVEQWNTGKLRVNWVTNMGIMYLHCWLLLPASAASLPASALPSQCSEQHPKARSQL